MPTAESAPGQKALSRGKNGEPIRELLKNAAAKTANKRLAAWLLELAKYGRVHVTK